MTRKVLLYIACSVDGFIAGENDDLSFLNPMHVDDEDYGYKEFTAKIDTVLWGRKTYDVVKAFDGPFFHTGRKVYVFSRTPQAPDENVEYVSEDVKTFVQKLKQEDGKHIYCDGGAGLVKALMEHDLIDEYIISTIPSLLGKGTRLFEEGLDSREIELLSSKAYPSGLVQNHYRRKR